MNVKWLGRIIWAVLSPLFIIAAFNGLFKAGIPWTLESWVLMFLAGIVAIVIIVLLFLSSILGFAAHPLVGFAITIAALIAIPIIYIASVNSLLNTMVPTTFQSYLLVTVILIGSALISGLVSPGGKK